MNHFKQNIATPMSSLIYGYSYISCLAIYLYVNNFYSQSSFFRFGTPVVFMGTTVTDSNTYYLILAIFFIHQMINNLINDVTYPWILNCVQDPKSKDILYSRCTSMIIINLFTMYSELDMILIITGAMNQITFFGMIILANMVSSSIINWKYVKSKNNFCEQQENNSAENLV